MGSPLEKMNQFLTQFTESNIPLLAALKPELTRLDEGACCIKIPLTDFSTNHLGSMYFGAIASGADCVGGFPAMVAIQESGARMALVFKDMHAEFLIRPDGDVVFECKDVGAIRELVKEALDSGERCNLPIEVQAKVLPHDDEPVAKFTMTLSIKKLSQGGGK